MSRAAMSEKKKNLLIFLSVLPAQSSIIRVPFINLHYSKGKWPCPMQIYIAKGTPLNFSLDQTPPHIDSHSPALYKGKFAI